ncbi:MAG: competence/damage-inducible protein A, partial [Duncaniella sp.]|nr:competence/damage-inducible protein A [Duncaniella sp.]
MNVSVIVIGDELLIGQVVDTNSGELARQMAPWGWRVADVQTVADDADAITRAIDRAMELSDIVLTTGGLGPTKDDITKGVLCDYFGGELRLDEATLENVRRVVSRRGIALNRLTADQAIVPTSATIIQNEVGTAPITWFERGGKVLV